MTEDKAVSPTRAPDYESGGRGFESCPVRQKHQLIQQFDAGLLDETESQNGTNSDQKSRTGAESPEKVPNGNPASFTWRGYARAVLLESGANSPLPTRQLKRATARAMGRLLEAKAHAEARREKIIARRKRKQ